MAGWLSRNRTGAWSSGGTNATGFAWGPTGVPGTSGFLSKVAWYRPVSGGNLSPSRIQVWDRGTQALIFELSPPPDNNAVGWQEYTLIQDVSLLAGREYTVALWVDPNDTWYYSQQSTPGTPDNPWSYAAVKAHSSSNLSSPYPGNTQAAPYFPNVDMEWSDVGGGGGETPSTATDLEAVMSSWLHSTANDHPTTSTPYLNFGLLTGLTADELARYNVIEGRIGTTAAAAGAASLFGKIKEILPVVANVASVAADVTTVLSHLNTPTSADEIGTVIDNLRGAQLREEGRANVPVGDTGWTLQDEDDFSASHFYEQFADAYVLTWTDTSYPANKMVVDGVEMVWVRDHWACECRDGAVGKHFPLNARVNDIRISGRRMPGLLIHNPAGYPFNIQSWVYTG